MFFLLVFESLLVFMFGIRLGEYLVAFGLVLSFTLVLIPNKYLKVPLRIHNLFRLILLIFVTLIVTDADF